MANLNRDMDVTQQKDVYNMAFGLLATGVTSAVLVAPYPCEVQSVRLAIVGASGSPTEALSIDRFIGGSGITNVTGGWTTLTGQNYGTSGVQSFVQVASGNSLIQMQAGDVLLMKTAGSNAASLESTITVVLKKLQDTVVHFGIAT